MYMLWCVSLYGVVLYTYDGIVLCYMWCNELYVCCVVVMCMFGNVSVLCCMVVLYMCV